MLLLFLFVSIRCSIYYGKIKLINCPRRTRSPPATGGGGFQTRNGKAKVGLALRAKRGRGDDGSGEWGISTLVTYDGSEQSSLQHAEEEEAYQQRRCRSRHTKFSFILEHTSRGREGEALSVTRGQTSKNLDSYVYIKYFRFFPLSSMESGACFTPIK